jgi:hypothetical protein
MQERNSIGGTAESRQTGDDGGVGVGIGLEAMAGYFMVQNVQGSVDGERGEGPEKEVEGAEVGFKGREAA